MPITFTALGDTLTAVVVDDNISSFEELVRLGYQQADFSGRFGRYLLERYTSGLIKIATSHAFPHRDTIGSTTSGIQETFDLSYRQALEEAKTFTIADTKLTTGAREAYAMELLGQPGPSFYLTFQEEGWNDPSAYAATGWPPSWWPISRFPDTYCYSRWLTIPGASLRIFMREPGIVKIRAQALGSSTWYNMVRHMNLTAAAHAGAMPWSDAHGQSDYHDRRYGAIRFGIIVDTNPVLYTDEFTNSNQHILDPVTGSTATHCSWKILRDMTIQCGQRERIQLTAEVALHGRGRWYNIRLVFRDAAHHGWLDHDGAPPIVFMDGVWEDEVPYGGVNDPVPLDVGFGAEWPNNQALHPFAPPVVSLWENTSITAEIDYGRETAYVESQDHPDWSSLP